MFSPGMPALMRSVAASTPPDRMPYRNAVSSSAPPARAWAAAFPAAEENSQGMPIVPPVTAFMPMVGSICPAPAATSPPSFHRPVAP